MGDIFISYASHDRDRVLPLVHALEKTGWTIFWDRTIPAGTTWRQRMDAEIKVCRSVLVVWTEKSVQSEWVLEEAEIGKRKQILVPVLLDEIEPPLGFRSIQAANLVAWNGSASDSSFGRLVSDIKAILGAAPGNGLPVEIKRECSEEAERNKIQERLRERKLNRLDEKGGSQAEGQPQSSRSMVMRALITGATKSSTWFRRITGILFATLLISVTILVVFEISLGWYLSPAEVSVIVSFIWVIVVAITALRSRSKQKRTHATD